MKPLIQTLVEFIMSVIAVVGGGIVGALLYRWAKAHDRPKTLNERSARLSPWRPKKQPETLRSEPKKLSIQQTKGTR